MQINDDDKNLNSQEIAAFLDKNKYQVIIGGKGVCKRNEKKYTIDEETYKKGIELHEKYIDAFMAGYCGIGLPTEELDEMLKELGYSDNIIELIFECMRCTAPIDLTIIHTIHNCRPTHNNIEISDEEKEHIIRGYIINVLKNYYEEIKNQTKNPPEKVDEDSSNIDINISIESVEKYKDLQTIDNIEIIYDLIGLSNSGLHFLERENLKIRAKVAARYGGKIQENIKDVIAKFAKEQRTGALERINNLFINQGRDTEEPRR